MKIREIAFVFFKLGSTAFGGPAAHIALMEEETVRRRQWLTHEEFLDFLGATNLIPGPNSTEMAIHIGYKAGGWKGLIAAGLAFILPATFIVTTIAWFYVRFGTLPALQSVFHAVTPVVLAVIAQAIWNLSKTAVKDRLLGAAAVLALLLSLAGLHELLILFLIPAALLLIRKFRPSFFLAGIAAVPADVSLEKLFLFFVKVGSILFGSGYVLIAFLRNDLVERFHWISSQQLLDAVAVGQFTPGPVFTTATFIGFLVAGPPGAAVATVGIFAPAFIFVALSAPLIPRLRRSPWAAPLLDGLNVASLGLMAATSLFLARGSLFSPSGALLFLGSLFLLIRHRINSAWLILGAALFGGLMNLYRF